MNLQDFVSETLIQIANGVKQAQEKSTENGATINPKLVGGASHAVQLGFLATRGGAAQIVQFDVALTIKGLFRHFCG